MFFIVQKCSAHFKMAGSIEKQTRQFSGISGIHVVIKKKKPFASVIQINAAYERKPYFS